MFEKLQTGEKIHDTPGYWTEWSELSLGLTIYLLYVVIAVFTYRVQACMQEL